MLCALIMAGGKGERFWPLSTEEKPKQFLNLLGKDTMIQMTVKRLERILPIERIFVVTGEKYVELLKKQIPNLPQNNIIVEPIGRNTALCVALSALVIKKYYEDATIVVVPSDHLIVDEEKYLKIINIGEDFVNKNSESIVTLGITPDRAETGYGYIKIDKYNSINNAEYYEHIKIYKVERFVEKPSIEVAQEYLKDGNYLWNSGMFIWKADHILKLTKKHLKHTYGVLAELQEAPQHEFYEVLSEKYKYVDNVSIDYGIMENAEEIYVIPADFGWDDVGTWKSVERYREKDVNNNVWVGDIKYIDSSNNIVMGNK